VGVTATCYCPKWKRKQIFKRRRTNAAAVLKCRKLISLPSLVLYLLLIRSSVGGIEEIISFLVRKT